MKKSKIKLGDRIKILSVDRVNSGNYSDHVGKIGKVIDYYYVTASSSFIYLVEVKMYKGNMSMDTGFWCDRVQLIPNITVDFPDELFEI